MCLVSNAFNMCKVASNYYFLGYFGLVHFARYHRSLQRFTETHIEVIQEFECAV